MIKSVLGIVIILCLYISANAQDYQLVPDSCTSCMFLNSDGLSGWNQDGYQILPDVNIVIDGENYMKICPAFNNCQWSTEGIRQVGNQLYYNSDNLAAEELIMDFDGQIGDTLTNIYSDGVYYSAVVIGKDSVLVNNGVYHHFMRLLGYGYFEGVNWHDSNPWTITWNERALCNANHVNEFGTYVDGGGIFYNSPPWAYSGISAEYARPSYCTTDPIYDTPYDVSCDNCNPEIISGIDEFALIGVSVYPNPASSILNIEFNETIDQTATILEIVDVKGRILTSHLCDSNAQQLDIINLNKGIYLLIITENQQIVGRKKLVVN